MSSFLNKLFCFFSFLFLALLFFLLPFGTLERIKGVAAFFVNPGKSFANISMRISREALGGLPENFSLEERDKLLQQTADANKRATLAELASEELLHQNQQLQRLLRLSRNAKEYTLSVCEVIRRNPLSDYYGTIVINRGIGDGLKAGQAVLSTEGLLGIITEVNSSDSLVTLLGSPKFSMPCKIAGKEISGLIHAPLQKEHSGGQLFFPASELHFDTLSGLRFNTVELGDLIISSSLGSDDLLAGITIGNITEVNTDNAGAYVCKVKPKASLENLRFVMVAIPAKP